MNYGLYFHIPFCLKKCNYCDFLSFNSFDISECDKSRYFYALSEEWKQKSNLIEIEDVIDSIYIGGGTPSFVDSEYIVELIHTIKDTRKVKNSAEITIEVNPGTVTESKLSSYYNAGINRLSIGIQSTHNRLLKSLGRIHNSNDCIETINLAKKVGFKNISCDLIFGIPQIQNEPAQTYDEFVTDLENVLLWGARHVSVYSLIIEECTEFYNLFKSNKLIEADPDEERKMYKVIPSLISKYNMKRYEISNYGTVESQSKHNLKYWKCHPYLGFGLGAASYYPQFISNKSNYIRESNTKIFNEYINLYFKGEYEIISIEEQMKEFMMLGFRCTSGPDNIAFKKRFGCDYIDIFADKLEYLKNEGLIKYNKTAKLTEKGFDFANKVFCEFI